MDVGDILSTMGDVQYHRGYHEYRVGLSWVLWGMLSTMGNIKMHVGISWVPWVFSTVGYSNNKRSSLPRYSWYLATCIMISPTVLGIPYGAQDNPRGTHDIPTVLKISPTFIMKYPTVLNIPHGTQDIPQHASWYRSRYQTPPRYCTHVIQVDLLTVLTYWARSKIVAQPGPASSFLT